MFFFISGLGLGLIFAQCNLIHWMERLGIPDLFFVLILNRYIMLELNIVCLINVIFILQGLGRGTTGGGLPCSVLKCVEEMLTAEVIIALIPDSLPIT